MVDYTRKMLEAATEFQAALADFEAGMDDRLKLARMFEHQGSQPMKIKCSKCRVQTTVGGKAYTRIKHRYRWDCPRCGFTHSNVAIADVEEEIEVDHGDAEGPERTLWQGKTITKG